MDDQHAAPEQNKIHSIYADCGDSLTTGADLLPGDVVYLERRGTRDLVLRVVTAEILPLIDGPLFVLVQDDDQGAFSLREVCRDDVA